MVIITEGRRLAAEEEVATPPQRLELGAAAGLRLVARGPCSNDDNNNNTNNDNINDNNNNNSSFTQVRRYTTIAMPRTESAK